MRNLAILLVAFIAASAILSCNQYTEIALEPKTMSVSKQWQELRPKQSLSWEKPQQELIFHIDSPHEKDIPNLGIIQPDGNRSVPEVQLVTNDGQTHIMDSRGFWGEEMFFTMRTPVRDIKISAFRIRNDFPIQISKVMWLGYDVARAKR